jgi:glycosyltransferase involved in cell wall biosynthesis
MAKVLSKFKGGLSSARDGSEEGIVDYSLAIILPAYNEELTIAETIEDFNKVLPNANIWVINNRSYDGTEKIATDVISRLRCGGGVINEQRPGKGNAVRRAFMDIDADIYILADADMTYPASQAPSLMAPVVSGEADMAVGDRHSAGHYAAENKRVLHGFGNRLVRDLVNKLFRSSLADIMSGYRVFNRRFVKSYPILVEGFEIETDMTLHALDKRFRIIEIPVNYRDRPAGSFSKLNTLRDGARVLSTIGNILRYYRPLFFFGGAAIFFSLLGLMAGIPVFEEWIRERYIHHVPLAILATGLEIVAIVLAAIGLILDSITHQDKRNFERGVLDRDL